MMSSGRFGGPGRDLGMLAYIAFPPKGTILARLETLEGEGETRSELYEVIADTLGSRTLDSAAFSFLLIELLHRHEELVDEDLATFLPRCILALTSDRERSEAARAAFGELGGP